MKKEVIKLQLVFKNHFKKRRNLSSQLFYKKLKFYKIHDYSKIANYRFTQKLQSNFYKIFLWVNKLRSL